jgi:diaminohydroxyphosphoribosylaminopyrimidine deaminase/5-amino-6-(5-phosphoribosylamino)uracil reductase
MQQALELAARGRGRVSPNPMVGAVLVAGEEIVGEGWYEGPRGSPHAEIRAIDAAGERARGATLYCTLEPCDHHGATPPCTEAIVGAGIATVVVAAGDPNPIVDGRGLARLRSAGLEVREGVLAREAHRLNAAFERWVTTGLPLVTLKAAASFDGKTAARDGSSRWITGEDARLDAHRLRAEMDAIAVGAGTALADDPSLTVRGVDLPLRPPLRVVIDAVGRIPASRTVFDDAAPTLVATTDRADARIVDAWTSAGAEVLVLDRDPAGLVPLGELVSHLGKRDVQGLLIEGGATLAGSFVRSGLVDRLILYVAPKLVGGDDAPGILAGSGVASIDDAIGLRFDRVETIGDDVRMEADVHRDR